MDLRASLLISASLTACAAAPKPTAEACIARFVQHQPLPHARVDGIFAAGDVRFFLVEYGKPNDCPAGCFFAGGVGIYRGCDRIGWIGLADYGEKPASWRLRYFRAGVADSVLYEEATWQAVENARQHTTRADAFFHWLLHAPEVPVEVKQRVKAHLAARTSNQRR